MQKLSNSFLNVKICCSSLSSVIVNEESLGLELLFGQKKQLEDSPLGNKKWEITINKNISTPIDKVKIIVRLINNRFNLWLQLDYLYRVYTRAATFFIMSRHLNTFLIPVQLILKPEGHIRIDITNISTNLSEVNVCGV